MELNDKYYRPGNLLDMVQDELDLKNDRALSRALEIAPSQISKLRNRKEPLSPAMLIVLSEAVDLTIGQLRHIAGLPRRMYIRR